MKTKLVKKKVVRVLLAIDIEMPAENPMSKKEGPGQYVQGFLQERVDDLLSDLPNWAQEDYIQKWNIGTLEFDSQKVIKEYTRRECERCESTDCPGTCD